MNKAKRTFYILIVVNILLIGGTVGVYIFATKLAKQKSQDIAITKADIETNDQSLNSFRELQRSLSQSAELTAIAKEVLPQDKNQSLALQEIEQFAKDSGVSVKQVTFITPTKSKTTGPTLTSPSNLKGVAVLSVSVKTDKMQYEQLLTLLKKFEDNRRRMQVTSISLTPSTTKLGQLDRVDLTVDIYLKP